MDSSQEFRRFADAIDSHSFRVLEPSIGIGVFQPDRPIEIPILDTTTEATTATRRRHRLSWWQNTLAVLLDVSIVLFVLFLAFYETENLEPLLNTSDFSHYQVLFTWALVAFFGFYQILFRSLVGQTPGQLLFTRKL